jgi:hypothetical protein
VGLKIIVFAKKKSKSMEDGKMTSSGMAGKIISNVVSICLDCDNIYAYFVKGERVECSKKDEICLDLLAAGAKPSYGFCESCKQERFSPERIAMHREYMKTQRQTMEVQQCAC